MCIPLHLYTYTLWCEMVAEHLPKDRVPDPAPTGDPLAVVKLRDLRLWLRRHDWRLVDVRWSLDLDELWGTVVER